MTHETLIKILEEKPIEFTLDEIQEMMDEELAKDPDEMDADLIDMCLDILDKGYAQIDNQVKQKAKKTASVRKIILIVAIIMVVVAFIIPVSAIYIDSSVSDKIVQVYADYFKINLRKDRSPNIDGSLSDTVNKTETEFNIDLMLPEVLKSYNLDNHVNIQNNENMTTLEIRCSDPGSSVSALIHVRIYDDESEFALGSGKITKIYTSVRQINVNGNDVLIFSNDSDINIVYIDEPNFTEYMIQLSECDIDTAVRIAKSIG